MEPEAKVNPHYLALVLAKWDQSWIQLVLWQVAP